MVVGKYPKPSVLILFLVLTTTLAIGSALGILDQKASANAASQIQGKRNAANVDHHIKNALGSQIQGSDNAVNVIGLQPS